MSEIIDAAVALTEHLMRASRRRIVDPLIKKLKFATTRRLVGNRTGNERTANPWDWRQVYERVTKDAYRAGARHAMSQLGPVSVTEAKRKTYPLPVLPDPQRTAELADQNIQWDDLGLEATAAAIASKADTIATTEIATAYHQGMAAFADLWRGGNGPTEKLWSAQPDACEEICLPNADMDWIDSEAPFDSGDFEPPGHPSCRCSLEYRATPAE